MVWILKKGRKVERKRERKKKRKKERKKERKYDKKKDKNIVLLNLDAVDVATQNLSESFFSVE